MKGTLVGTNKSDSDAIRKHLETWVGEQTQLTVIGVELTASSCPISSEEGECGPVSDRFTSSSSESDSSSLLYVVVVLGILFVFVVALVLACGILLRRKFTSRKRRYVAKPKS